MPKKKSSRPAASLGSNQRPEPKSAGQAKRERIVRIAAITIVLALLLSLLAGAFSVTPSQAADSPNHAKSVQITNGDVSPVGTGPDTDGDGIENNLDPDIDNDGVVNANDGDIDGDGTSNFDDGDPAATNGFDGNAPRKPGSISLQELVENGSLFWLMGVGLAVLVTLGLILAKTLKKRGQKAKKNF
jgi:hypothetical protein